VSPLRIVLVLLEAPVPFGHASARWSHVLLRELVRRGHRVTAFAACSKPEEIAPARALFPAPAYDLRAFPFPERRGVVSRWRTLRRPFSYMFGRELREELERELAKGYDVLHLEQLWSAWLGLEHPARALASVHNLYRIDLADTPPEGARGRVIRKLQLGAEEKLLRGLSHFRASSPRVAGEIARVNHAARVSTAPLGIDPALYEVFSGRVEPVVSVIGNMSWQPSLSAAERFLERLWPEISRRVPAARAQVAGWGAKRALARFAGMPRLTIEEDVADIRPAFERTRVLLYAPGRGSGVKIKVQEALLWGVPVVTTREGVEGLEEAQDGVHAGIAEDDAGLVERTVRLLEDESARERQRREGRALVERCCGPDATVSATEAIYARVLS
jgi:glycosyltransferase involved in cell wall biosynthesis